MRFSPSVPQPLEIHDALEHLYDGVALARCALAKCFPEAPAEPDAQARASWLRGTVLGAIEALQPARQEPFGSRGARSYEVLNLRYVEGMSVAQVAEELSLVERQVYRDLRRAYGELAQVLGGRSTIAPALPDPSADDATPLRDELARVVARPKRLDVAQVLAAAYQAAAPLAERLGCTLELAPSSALPPISADEGLLRQVLIQMLSLAVQSAGSVALAAERDAAGDRLAIRVRFRAERRTPRLESLAALANLADRQHLHWREESLPEGAVMLEVSAKAAAPRTLLVIEDNAGAIELYRRFLAQEEGWQIVGVEDPRLSLELATRLRPAAVVLDVMMPQQDGWTVLQSLRADPRTATTPVIVCSVFEDTALATALGASGYLTKPVSQLRFLAALRRIVH